MDAMKWLSPVSQHVSNIDETQTLYIVIVF
jgi:hypothetical protein